MTKDQINDRRYYLKHKNVLAIKSKNRYQLNKEHYKIISYRRYKRNYDYINSFKHKPCTDCKNVFPIICMEFDHIDPYTKYKSIAALAVSSSLEKIRIEITKCELVCSNCHQIRTYTKKQYVKRILQ